MLTFKRALVTTIILVGLSACGGSDSADEAPVVPPPISSTQIHFTLGLSDAPVDEADEVVITIETITFKREDGDDVVFETFSNEAEGIVDAETITLDLLQFQGSAQFNVLEGELIDVGSYNQVILNVLDEDIELSYVTELGGARKSIKVPSDNLKLGGIEFNESDDNQQFTIEFNLRKSMTYKPGPDEYNLKPRGVRIVNNNVTGTISGTVDVDAINALDNTCLPEQHLVYLFEGEDLETELLADNFDDENTNSGAPENAIAPFDSVAPVFDNDVNSYHYEFGFVPQGNYTLAYACNTGENGDDADIFDDILMPNPATEIIGVEVDGTETTSQDFPINAL